MSAFERDEDFGVSIVAIFAEAQRLGSTRAQARAIGAESMVRCSSVIETPLERIGPVLLAPGGVDRTNAAIAKETGHDVETVARVRCELRLPSCDFKRRSARAVALLKETPSLTTEAIALAAKCSKTSVGRARRALGIELKSAEWDRRRAAAEALLRERPTLAIATVATMAGCSKSSARRARIGLGIAPVGRWPKRQGDEHAAE